MGKLNHRFLHVQLMEDHIWHYLYLVVQRIVSIQEPWLSDVSVSLEQLSSSLLRMSLLAVRRALLMKYHGLSGQQAKTPSQGHLSGRMAWAGDKSVALGQFQHLAAQGG